MERLENTAVRLTDCKNLWHDRWFLTILLHLCIPGGGRRVVSYAEGQRSSETASFVIPAKHPWGVSLPCLCVYRRTMKDTTTVRDEHLEQVRANGLTRLGIKTSCQPISKSLETSYTLPKGSGDLQNRWRTGICGSILRVPVKGLSNPSFKLLLTPSGTRWRAGAGSPSGVYPRGTSDYDGTERTGTVT